MIKVNTVGMLNVAKINPVLKSDKDVPNYSFITDEDILYLVANTITGDDAYKEDVTIKAGDFLNGYIVEAWKGQELVVDLKHIDGDAPTKGAILVVDTDSGKLKAGSAAGVHFVVTEANARLTGAAVRVRVVVA